MMSKILIGTGWTASGTGLYRRASQRFRAQVAQLVEHVTENHGVGGSIPSLGTITLEVIETEAAEIRGRAGLPIR